MGIVWKGGARGLLVFLCPASTQVTLEQYQQLRFGRSQVNRHICYTGCCTQVNDLRPLGLVPWTTNTTPGEFDEQRFQNGGLKGALVVVAVVVVATTTAIPSSFDTWTKGHLRLCPALSRPRSLGS